MDLEGGLGEQLESCYKQALRSQNKEELAAIRFLKAEIQKRAIAQGDKLDDAQISAVLRKLCKQGRDAERQFLQGKRQDLAAQEARRVAIYQRFLAPSVDDEQMMAWVEQALSDLSATQLKHMGAVMAHLKQAHGNDLDMARIAPLVKKRLK